MSSGICPISKFNVVLPCRMLRNDVKLYHNISGIRWQYDCLPGQVKGCILSTKCSKLLLWLNTLVSGGHLFKVSAEKHVYFMFETFWEYKYPLDRNYYGVRLSSLLCVYYTCNRDPLPQRIAVVFIHAGCMYVLFACVSAVLLWYCCLIY